MRNIKFSIILLFVAEFLAVSCSGGQKSVSYDELRVNFQSPPADVRVGVYWYWMNDNISVEGVQKDLEAMKTAGITKAFIGNIGGETQFPLGKVRIFTDEWWEVIHAALKKAAELDIEIGMFNCPGWSQSGGPWIKPNQAMRYLAFADTVVVGGQTFTGILQPEDSIFQDVKVLAFPVNNNLYGGITQTGSVPGRSKAEIAISLPEPEKMRTLVIHPVNLLFGECELQAKTGTEYQTVRKFEVDRSNNILNVGWDKLANVVITFPETEAQDFRLIFNNKRRSNAHFLLTLTAVQGIERYPEKTLAKMFQYPLPHWDSYLWKEESADTALSVNPANIIDISDKLATDG
ncbi:MAG: glycoside hydrolase family 2, partial [Candidatus Symbiothrix sp.]|nr:glycoside hydrolase family 2 [Candidatus Symbiothrix sp.]